MMCVHARAISVLTNVTQISISTHKHYDIKTYKHTIHTWNWSVLYQNVCIYNTQYMVTSSQVRSMTIVHKVADQDSVLLTIA